MQENGQEQKLTDLHLKNFIIKTERLFIYFQNCIIDLCNALKQSFNINLILYNTQRFAPIYLNIVIAFNICFEEFSKQYLSHSSLRQREPPFPIDPSRK